MATKHRPPGITFLAVVYFAVALLLLVPALTMPHDVRPAPGAEPIAGKSRQAVQAAIVLVSVIAVLIGAGLWRMKRWARTIITISVLTSLPFALLAVLRTAVALDCRGGAVPFAGFTFQLWIGWYMFQPHVRAAFRHAEELKTEATSAAAGGSGSIPR